MSSINWQIANGSRFYVTGGTLSPDALSYVERQADVDLLQALEHGEFCYVLHARQMGKSSLMVRTAARLREAGIRVAVLDLTQIGKNLTPEQWYGGLLISLGEQIGLTDQLDAFWLSNTHLGPLQRWIAALEHCVLAERKGQRAESEGHGDSDPLPHAGARSAGTPPLPQGRLVVFVDEIDVVRSLPFSTDEFFAAIRECYNRRVRDPRFTRLTFCLLGVASPTDLIQDPRTTPFNIGRRIELGDFADREAAHLAAGLMAGELGSRGRSDREARALLKRVLYWTGGHPYLTQRFCQALAADPRAAGTAGADRMCEALFLSHAARDNDNNLSFVRDWLLRADMDRASILDLYAQARHGRPVPDDETIPLIPLLKLSGVVRPVPARRSLPWRPARRCSLRVCNRIYARVFDRAWIAANMPGAELRRQRAAYRRGVVRSASVFGVLLGGTVMALLAVGQNQQARIARERGRTVLYAASMSLAHAAVREGNYAYASDLLAKQRPKPGESDLRGFEWRYLAQLCHRERLTLPEPDPPGSLVQYVGDGSVLATGSANDTLRLWSASSGRLLRVIESTPADLHTAIALSRSGTLLATASAAVDRSARPHRVKKWEVTLTDLKSERRAIVEGSGVLISCLAVSPDGKLFATGTANLTPPVTAGEVALWDAQAARRLGAMGRHAGSVTCLAFSADGRILASAGNDGVIYLWDAITRRQVSTLRGQRYPVRSLAFAADGSTLAVGSEDGTVTLWNTVRHQAVRQLRGHTGWPTAMDFSPSGESLAVATAAPRIRGVTGKATLWSLARNARSNVFEGHTGGIWSIAFSRDGRAVATGGGDGEVRCWDVSARPDPLILAGHHTPIHFLSFDPRDGAIVTASDDGSVRIWNRATESIRATFRLPPDELHALALDGRMLALTSGQREIIRNLDTQRDTVVDEHAPMVTSIGFSPDGRVLAAGDAGGVITIWDLAQHRRTTLKRQTGAVRQLAVSADSRTLAAYSEDSTVTVWSLAEARLGARFAACNCSALALSPDGRLLAIGLVSEIRLCDLLTREETSLLGHLGRVTCLAFSPDSRTLASGGEDSAIRLWSPAAHQQVGYLEASALGTDRLQFLSDGNVLAAGCVDGTLRLWSGISLDMDPRAPRAGTPSPSP